jgi:tRNA nucleotidyltransferase (CCA-adding enzyme)
MEKRPSRMFEVLEQANALPRIARELAMMLADRTRREPALGALDYAASRDCGLAIRFGALTHRINDDAPYESRLATLCDRMRVPNDCRELARLALSHFRIINRPAPLPAEAVAQLLDRCDAYRKPERFVELLKCCACVFHAARERRNSPYPQAVRLQAALAAARDVNAGAIAEAAPDPSTIGARIHHARVAAIAAAG